MAAVSVGRPFADPRREMANKCLEDLRKEIARNAGRWLELHLQVNCAFWEHVIAGFRSDSVSVVDEHNDPKHPAEQWIVFVTDGGKGQQVRLSASFDFRVRFNPLLLNSPEE